MEVMGCMVKGNPVGLCIPVEGGEKEKEGGQTAEPDPGSLEEMSMLGRCGKKQESAWEKDQGHLFTQGAKPKGKDQGDAPGTAPFPCCEKLPKKIK